MEPNTNQTRIIPARIVLDVDEETGQEFAYEWKSVRDNPSGEWLNLTNEQYYSDEFVKSMELDVLCVEFAGIRQIMTGPDWRAQGSPRFLRVEKSTVDQSTVDL